ncbi:hypothetical protein EVAR_77012_1 [Eumeta japonica]|uniref:Uncharacterized protein n=1 Tax=Eumeta variegata TaxID=151549 RepID=A0A4C1SI62_EUMVA|nr:hypothetical protein EVAR_77012_1 [Eumeta japonica]
MPETLKLLQLHLTRPERYRDAVDAQLPYGLYNLAPQGSSQLSVLVNPLLGDDVKQIEPCCDQVTTARKLASRPVRYNSLSEYRREVVAITVAFRPTKSLSNRYRMDAQEADNALVTPLRLRMPLGGCNRWFFLTRTLVCS